MLATICFSLAGAASIGATWAGALIQALLFVAVIVGAVVVVMCCWAIVQQLIIGGALIALFAFVTFPRGQGVTG